MVSGFPWNLGIMAAMVGTLCFRRNLSFFARSSVLSIRQALPGRHNPSLKKKTKPGKDQKKKRVAKLVRKPTEIVPPTDPESLLNLALLEPHRRREQHELSESEKEKRILLLKEWSRFKMQQHKEELQCLQELTRCREEALKELKKTSISLYQEAIKTDKNLFPLHFKGPPETPPIPGYVAPDMDEKWLI